MKESPTAPQDLFGYARTVGAYVGAGAGTNRISVEARDRSAAGNQSRSEWTATLPTEQTLTWDAAGNLLTDGTRTYTWDAAQRLKSVSIGPDTWSFEYDGYGRRLRESKNGTLQHQWVWAGTQIAERRTPTGTVDRRYYAHGETRIGTPDAGHYYYTKDHLGSIREVLDTNGKVVARYDYTPFGQRERIAGTFTCDFGYTGHHTHAATGLVLTLYRAYDPELRMWLSPDPIGEAGGLNLYGYVGNDPVNRWDPYGLAWECTPTQGIHYNDRQGNFGFALGTDESGALKAISMGGNHTFDQARADNILNKAISDKKKWKNITDMNTKSFDDPSYRNKGRIRSIGRAIRRAGVVAGGVGAIAGLNELSNVAASAYQKCKRGGTLSGYEKQSLLTAIYQSGIPGRTSVIIFLEANIEVR